MLQFAAVRVILNLRHFVCAHVCVYVCVCVYGCVYVCVCACVRLCFKTSACLFLVAKRKASESTVVTSSAF